MRIAIVLYGEFRFYENSNISFNENVLNQFPNSEIKTFGVLWHKCPIDDETKKLILAYPNSHINFMPQKSFDDIRQIFGNTKTNLFGNHFISQLYSLHQGYNLLIDDINQHGEYDLFIKSRTDLIFHNKIDPIFNEAESLYVTKDCFEGNFCVNDAVAITRSRNTFEKICNMGFELDTIANRTTDYLPHEKAVAFLCDINKVNTTYYNMKWDLARHYC